MKGTLLMLLSPLGERLGEGVIETGVLTPPSRR